MLVNHYLAERLAGEHHEELLRQAEEERNGRMARDESNGKRRSGRELIAFLRRTQRAVRRPGIPVANRGCNRLRRNGYRRGRRPEWKT